MARCSSEIKSFLSMVRCSLRVEPLYGIPLHLFILRPNSQVYLWRSSISPLLEIIIFETVLSGFFFASRSSGYRVSLILRSAFLYYSLTGMSLSMNIGWSSLQDLVRESPEGWMTIEENGYITSWKIRLRSGNVAFSSLFYISRLHLFPSPFPGVVKRSLWNSDSDISYSDSWFSDFKFSSVIDSRLFLALFSLGRNEVESALPSSYYRLFRSSEPPLPNDPSLSTRT